MGVIYRNSTLYGGGGGSGGHNILDNDGNSLPQEDNLQFKGLNVTDNSTDEITEVEALGLNQDDLDELSTEGIKTGFVQSSFNYSTEEQIVGKWVDGKPIYQKTLHLNLSDFVGSWPFKYYSLASLNMDKIISAPKGCFYYNNVTWVNIPDIEVASSGFNGNYTATWTVRSNSTDRELLLSAQSEMQSRIGEMYITIQYTKSTD